MIKFTDVSKMYLTKSKSKVHALKGVSFELASNGMTFILGKSGSGKSTLLNLLGGLDKPTVGQIEIDGTSMQSFTQADCESYRNSYVGFVFQEYNLLDDFNVKENVALALQLSKDVNVEEKVKEALKQVELGEEYLNRRVGELSGGEKQRVAIARAIVKDSKIILADEPTGNIDSATGESIWNILKNLSRERLVVVVSHDRESAEKYADRIIEIADGKIIADNGKEQDIKPAEQTKFTATKQRLSFAMLLKMGFNSLFKHKARAICVILASVFAVSALLVSQIMLTFLPERSIAQYIMSHDAPYVTVGQGRKDDVYGLLDGSYTMTYATRKYIKKNAQTLDWGVVESKQELLDFGFEFVGEALELDSQSFYIRDSELERILGDAFGMERNTFIEDGEEKSLFLTLPSIERLIGKQVRLSFSGNKYYTLAGVIKSVNVDIAPTWTTVEFDGRKYSHVIGSSLGSNNGYVLSANDSNYGDDFRFYPNDKWLLGGMVITDDGLLYLDEELPLGGDEIIISFGFYSKLLKGGLLDDYVLDGQLVKTPSVLNDSVSLKVLDSQTNETVVDLGNYKIKGITLDEDVCIHSNKIDTLVKSNVGELIVKTDSVSNIQFFLVNLRTKYTGKVADVGTIECKSYSSGKADIARIIYDREDIYQYGVILLAICLVLVLVMILLAINLISFSINSRKKEIGILSAIGASAWDIAKIFIIETLVMSIFIFALALIAVFSAVGVFNLVFTAKYSLAYLLTFFVVDPYSILTLFGVSFAALPLFALLPTIRIARLKPIDAIRVL